MTEMKFELAPSPSPDGSPKTIAERRAELDGSRFVAVRNLATVWYKKSDGTPLMEYRDTLSDREVVKQKILEFEMENGFIRKDSQSSATPTGPQPAVLFTAEPEEAPQNGTTMNMPASFAPPSPMAAPPTPAAAPAEGLTQGRGRRRAAGALGSAVAPPPGLTAAPAASPMVAPMPAPMAAPVPMAPPAPMMSAPAPMAFSGPAAFSIPPAVPVPAPSGNVDLAPVMDKINQIGKGLEVAANNADAAVKAVGDLKKDMQFVLAAIHHLYKVQVDPNAPNTLPDFLKHMSKYIGPT